MNVKHNIVPSDYKEDLHSDLERQRLTAARIFVERGRLSDWPGEIDRTFAACRAPRASRGRR